MTNERYMEIEKAGCGITQEEWNAGWHWCYDWDCMLVGPGMQAQESCLCFKGVYVSH
jgi:hypothetical protein